VAYGDGATFLPLQELLAQPVPEAAAQQEAARAALATAASPVEIFVAFRRFVEAAAAVRPVLVVLDDVHWAEPSFLDLVDYLAGFATDAAVLVLCLARPDPATVRAAWGAPIALEPLADEDASALAAHLAPAAEHGPVVARAEGNPLFLEQLLAFATDADVELLPATVDALLAARLDLLQPDGRAVLEAAAVVGREFWRGAVEHLDPPVAPGRVVGELLGLVRSGLVHPDRSLLDGEDAFRFHHVLIRDAAYRAIPKKARVGLHERAADWLAQLPGENDELVGHHLEQAYRLGAEVGAPDAAVARAAGEALARAGERARSRVDFPATQNLLERALALLPADHPDAPRVASHLVEVLTWNAPPDRAAALLERALVGAGARDALVLRLRRAYLEFHNGLPSTEPTAPLVQATMDAFEGAGDDEGLALAWNVAAAAHNIVEGLVGTAGEEWARSIVHASRAGDRFGEATAFAGVSMSLTVGPLPLDEALRRHRRHLEEYADRIVQSAAAHLFSAYAEALAGCFEQSREHYRTAVELATQMGNYLPVAASRAVSAYTALLSGDLAEAEAEARRGCDGVRRLGYPQPLARLQILLAEVLSRTGRLDEAEAELAAAAEPRDLEERQWYRATRAKLLALRGLTDEAVPLAEAAVAAAAATQYVLVRADTGVALAHVLALAHRPADAERAFVAALGEYERKGATGAADDARRVWARALARA
jgi:hypothetical protein